MLRICVLSHTAKLQIVNVGKPVLGIIAAGDDASFVQFDHALTAALALLEFEICVPVHKLRMFQWTHVKIRDFQDLTVRKVDITPSDVPPSHRFCARSLG